MFNGYRLRFFKMKRVLEVDGGDVCTMLSMYLIAMNYTFLNGEDG